MKKISIAAWSQYRVFYISIWVEDMYIIWRKTAEETFSFWLFIRESLYKLLDSRYIWLAHTTYWVWKLLPSKQKTKRNWFRFDNPEYVNKIYNQYLIPFLFSLNETISEVRIVRDSALYSKSSLNKTFTSTYTIWKLHFLANFLYLSLIENT